MKKRLVFYVFNKFDFNGKTDNIVAYNCICDIYYPFMTQIQKTTIDKMQLIAFYIFSCYCLQAIESNCSLPDLNMSINYHDLNELNDKNNINIFTTKF